MTNETTYRGWSLASYRIGTRGEYTGDAVDQNNARPSIKLICRYDGKGAKQKVLEVLKKKIDKVEAEEIREMRNVEADVLHPNGARTPATVCIMDGEVSLAELYDIIGTDMVQRVVLRDGREMWLDEEGKFKDNPKRNAKATALLWAAGGSLNDYVAGKAVIVNLKTNRM